MSLADLIIYNTEAEAIQAIASGEHDLDELDRFGMRPLIHSVICKKFEVMQALLAYGADLEKGDFINRTPLQWAVDRGEIDFCYFFLQCGANPNHYSADGQPILVNPILREQLDIVDLFLQYNSNYQFAEDYISAKLLGHRFELTGEADIVSPSGTFIPLSFEGFNLEFSSGLIHRSLNNFVNSMEGHKYTKMQGKLRVVLEALQNGAKLTEYAKHKDKAPFEKAINKILANDLILIPAAYQGHAITFIKYKNYWARCDRGVGKIVDTVVIYEIGNPYILNLELYYKLLYQEKDEKFIRQELTEMLKLKTLTTLPTHRQITGNCSWANIETSVPTMLYMITYNPEYHGLIKTGSLKKAIYNFYDDWVDWDKDTALDEAIETFVAAKEQTRKLSKAMIFAGILSQCCNPKYKTHIRRAKKILSILINPNYNFTLRNIIKVFSSKKAGKSGKRIKKLFKACKIDLHNLTMKEEIDYYHANVHSDNLVRMTTELHSACLNGNLEKVKELVLHSGIDVDYLDRTGSTALMYAAWKGKKDIVKFLVENGANAHIKNLKGGTAARYAEYSGYKEIVEYLTDII